MLFIEAKNRFLTYLEAKGDSQRTVGTYDQRLRLFIENLGKGMDTELEDFLSEELDIWVAGMRRRGLAPATVKNRLRDVKTFFRWCVLRGYLDVSPAEHLPIKGRWSQTEIKAMAREDLMLIVEAATHNRDQALVRFIASTGCRAGEVASLRIENLDLVSREAKVIGKTGRRMVDFNKKTAAALAAWLKEHPNIGCGFVFVSLRAPYPPANVGTIYQLFRRLARDAGVNGRFNPHSVRHLVGQEWTDKTNLELTRQKLGHKDITTTMVYANQDRSRLKKHTELIDLLNGI